MSSLFYSGWLDSIPISFYELNGSTPLDSSRIMLTSNLLGISNDVTKFDKEYKAYYGKQKPLMVKKWNIQYPSTIDDLLLEDILLVSKNSLLDILVDFLGVKKPEQILAYLDSQNVKKNEQLPALLFLFEHYRKDRSFIIPKVDIIYNGYKQIKKLGEGAYGTVYLVEKNGIQYADKEMSQLELNELDVLSRFDHPNISRAIDFFEHNGNSHIILELAESDLYDKISSYKVDDKTKIMWCYQLTSAMWFFHKQEYYHCDFKPQNVLIVKGNAVMADFGLAYPIEMEQDFCGTPTWTAPEGLQSHQHGKSYWHNQHIDHRKIDIYSLGLTIAFILSEQQLIDFDKYGTNKAYDVFLANPEKEIKKLNLPSEWTRLIIHMCQSDVNQRPATIEEVLSHEAFKSNGYSTPIGGKIIDVYPVECKIKNKHADIINEWILEVNNKYKNIVNNISEIYMAIDLFYRLTPLLGYKLDKLQLLICASFVITDKFYNPDHDELTSIDMWTKYSAGAFKEKELSELVEKIPYILKGKIRNRTLYDYAISLDEVIFGLYNLMNCSRHNQYTNIEDLHNQYLKYETIEQRQKRKSKHAKTTSLDLNEHVIRLLTKYSDDKMVEMLGQVLQYQCVNDSKMVTENALKTRLIELKDSTITLQDMKAMCDYIKYKK